MAVSHMLDSLVNWRIQGNSSTRGTNIYAGDTLGELDHTLVAIIDAMEKEGLSENTLVFYTAGKQVRRQYRHRWWWGVSSWCAVSWT
jgi:arylsulfatase A-like enzyme